MEKVKTLFSGNIRKYGMGIALISIMILFEILTNGILLKPLNITNLILQNSYILILAIGMLLVIVTGNIDLSVGSIAAFVGAIGAMLMINYKISAIPAMIICLIIGAAIGAWQGFWIAYVKIPAFIVTLAGMLIFRGLTLVILQGQTLAPFPELFQSISSGFIPGKFTAIIVGISISIIFVLLQIKDRNSKMKNGFDVQSVTLFIIKCLLTIGVINIFMYWLAAYNGIPTVLVLLTVLIIGYSFIANKTIIGRHIYALGGNQKAAELSGVNTRKTLFLVYINMGIIAALAGMIFAGRLNAATPKAGANFELDAIAACYIGGASAMGGIGSVFGAIIGGFVMGVLNNGMSILGIGVDWQQAIKGLVLLIAVAFDVYTKSKATNVNNETKKEKDNISINKKVKTINS
ncbi:multiple monosaccharide ABC transporter permease [Clostridium sp. D46t1_190503_E9]|uniref:multiple monosaccharide ABC transporter permease n=1 Tax=Clostridium sp. D46t1_190503_E9 TaxID=2787137 RepID=UPI0018976B78|nr:multiple monosaccharide ABC transporter permease [Clostridium sp. D46t1_190503_E9]